MDDCLKSRLALVQELNECRGLINAMGSETRQLIVTALLESDNAGLRVGEITAKTHLSRPAVSHHLKILRDAKIITLRRCGTMNFYYMDTSLSEWTTLRDLITHICQAIEQAQKNGYLQEEKEDWNGGY